MIVVKLMGGLGNQMFQYAAGRELAVTKKTSLVLDHSFLENQPSSVNFTKRNFELDIFGQIEFRNRRVPNIIWWVARKVSKLFPRLCYFVQEPSFPLNNVASESFWLHGYFQSEKYFFLAADEIRKDFRFTLPLSEISQSQKNKIVTLKDSVAVHIRRGDYITNPAAAAFHGTCTTEYYMKAVEYIKTKLSSPTFVFFSDDISWVREQFKDLQNCVFIDSDKTKSNWEDLCLMQMCKHNVIANSSFSWWAAWLNSNPEKIVLAPSKWFLGEEDSSEIVPKSWIRM